MFGYDLPRIAFRDALSWKGNAIPFGDKYGAKCIPRELNTSVGHPGKASHD